ncbi:hypothetical protein [Methylobacterium sp. NFXW15]|uniref:hypothetical protein n=1 Tax=Methylobacterium sp. NFXW15 TaxID=2819512 RepID=UPI003CEE5592
MILLVSLAAGSAVAQDAGNKPPAPRDIGPPKAVSPTTPPNSTVVVAPDTQKSGPGANTTIARSGSGADTITTDTAVGGNAEQQTRAVPLAGGGSGGSGGGGS